MKIEQTRIFQRECERFYHYALEYRFSSDSQEMAMDLLITCKDLRGKEFAAKVAKKANQKAKSKFYDISVLDL